MTIRLPHWAGRGNAAAMMRMANPTPSVSRWIRPRWAGRWLGVAWLSWWVAAGVAGAAELAIDFTRTNGVIRPLHGGNNGPLCQGETVDLTAYHRELAIPLTRLHDSAWPYPDVVDVHAVFPQLDADPDDPRSYRFGPTDDYVRAITNAGSRIVYRLGESIEHAKRKRYVFPPPDAAKWAQICLGIIRHYNEGWADGHRLGIEYWEIWNEPENRPAMWTGTPAQYYELYATTAKAIKQRWPELKVGGPSLGYQGAVREGRLAPSEFLRGFIDHVRQAQAPLDFFSWHGYSDDPGFFARQAVGIRAFLDREGFPRTESHLNEWNYLPDHDWRPMLSGQGIEREKWYARQGGIEGAAFAAAVLISLQDTPVDAANYYSADSQPFGLFTLHGAPKKTFHAFRAFRAMLETPVRVTNVTDVAAGPSADARRWWLAGLARDRRQAALLIALPVGADGLESARVSGLPWNGRTEVEIQILDADEANAGITRRQSGMIGRGVIDLKLKASAVALVRLFEEAEQGR